MSSPFVPIETANIVWRDSLPFSCAFNDIYFSTENGLAETEYVFSAGNQLPMRWQSLAEGASFVIAETGFGSGLNFLLSWFLWLKYAPATARLYFISCEKFPLTKADLTRCLALWPTLQEQAQALLEKYPVLTPGFHHLQFADGRINLTLMLGDATVCFNQLLICGEASLEQQLRTNYIDAWFLDGFAPIKNPAMWSPELFHAIGLLSKPDTTLATFSVAAVVKKNLQAAGFQIEKVKGFGRKRDMLIARFKETFSSHKKCRSTPWHSGTPLKVRNKKAIVIGAGLAGCYTAFALAKRGWEVILLDEHQETGQGASANPQAVLYPTLSAHRSPLTQFMLASFLFANRVYNNLLQYHAIGDLSGALQLISQEKLPPDHLKTWLASYPELGKFVNARQASMIAGIELKSDGLFLPYSGWLNSQRLCRLLRQTSGIHWIPDTTVKELKFDEGSWHVANQTAEVLILANGYQATQFEQTASLPLKAIRGQMTFIAANTASARLKIPICGDGHVLPAFEGLHTTGASYHLNSIDKNCLVADDYFNLGRLAKLPVNLEWSNDIKTGWTGIRAATPDYLPMVGPVPDAEIFRSRFASLATNAKRWLPISSECYPGLFVCTGFGSKGLTTIPLCAEWLAAFINNEPDFITRSMVQSLSPARFLHKEIVKNSSGK
ncbi:bifunctional tRNA (5-methylaminomethyl-2-thiouridine)(34)-methyltransferase MnmD/FAD-dependent 5-carboxymethylaminomethyl-2-thiouridine(34) oxidoreductase MnmC [Legionella fairfieldensis]|uniref:bifunctional tRNA (5-methylaminomethyl-2-thiouridine)(34)-methyltransferase MnmD/FAD-dependent 5-carboxymethylaminomethyl-2-thiouridine(34) oxidoreductase MnmC n=1 Tax=Legionella fairfieldensis TaxID=45064 RepID=UPI000491EEE4|nr:bifunctional tRNA (5-methylaminomethyl-2-thiouridine)(34)-methyltransferase MnmD/FAD-dependent 5-carboxymethylaminomethyl-2-thiouridine(34) oxidoreductase MnmC [Legionella fairfieldensis]